MKTPGGARASARGAGASAPASPAGCEWIVEAHGCDPDALGDPARLRALVDRLVAELSLTPVGAPLWHAFPGAGGVTGLVLLAESHVACHTFPEHGSLCLNVFCCRPRPDWDAATLLGGAVGATEVTVRRLERQYGRWTMDDGRLTIDD